MCIVVRQPTKNKTSNNAPTVGFVGHNFIIGELLKIKCTIKRGRDSMTEHRQLCNVHAVNSRIRAIK